MAFNLLYRSIMFNAIPYSQVDARTEGIMSKITTLLILIGFLVLFFGLAHSVAAQEWNILSKENGPGFESVRSFLEMPFVSREYRSASKKSEQRKLQYHPPTGQDLIRSENDRNREYAREGSWAPLETRPGEESFHLFTF